MVKVFDDFTGDQSDVHFVDTVTDSGSAAVGDAVNGVMVLTPSDGSVVDNDEAYIKSANELFKFGTNRCIYGRWKIKYHETTADVANIAVGFQNAVGADSIIDDGGGVKTSGSTLAIYKLDGGTKFVVASACNGTATTTTTNKDCDEETDYVLEIEATDWDGVSMQVNFRVDGEYLRDSDNEIIKHKVAIANATEMQVWAGIKLGASTNNDTLDIDYIFACQTRI